MVPPEIFKKSGYKDMQPVSATLYAFNVGFGDCSLLRFDYSDNARRHVLIDFGSTRQPSDVKSRPKNFMKKVAEQIKEICEGKLDVVIATHRHKDHIDGFRTNTKGTAPGNVIASCNPGIVLQPWTEHPDAPTDAAEAPANDPDSQNFARSLYEMERYAQNLFKASKRNDGLKVFNAEERKSLAFFGENNIANKSAVKNLMTMGSRNPQYLNFGKKVSLGSLLPGVEVDVLGPPTLKQHGEIRKQRTRHETEYWHLQANAISKALNLRSSPLGLFDSVEEESIPAWADWGKERLNRIQRNSTMKIVRRLDRQMNNTSLILLFSVNDKALLFPGDAQWENWSYALSDQETREKLKSVDLYKVGHHGSLNATPKSLWKLFENRSKQLTPDRMHSIMSTKEGVHGHTKETAVPKKNLVDALDAETSYFTTESVKIDKNSKTFYQTIKISFS